MDYGTDRDVAQLILSALTSTVEKVVAINDNLYVPHIVTQPEDFAGAIGEDATFTVVANNVSAYLWQYKVPGGSWANLGPTNNQPTLTFEITEARIGNSYRCRITGKDGSTIVSSAGVLSLAEDNT